MTGFIIGCIVGGLVGVSVMCLFQAGADADRRGGDGDEH